MSLCVAVLLVLTFVCQSNANNANTCDKLMREQGAAKEKFVVNYFVQAMLQVFCSNKSEGLESDVLGMVSNGSNTKPLSTTTETPFCDNYYCPSKENTPTNVDVKDAQSAKIPWRDSRTPQSDAQKRQLNLKFGDTTTRANTSCLCPRDMIAVPVIVIECKHRKVVEENDG